MLSPLSYRLRRSSASEVRSPPVIRLPLPRSAVFESAMSPLRVWHRPAGAPRPPGHMITHGPGHGHANSNQPDQVAGPLAPGVLGSVGQQDPLVGVQGGDGPLVVR